MKVLVCIDDTGKIGSMGTGDLAEILAKTVEERGIGKCSGITRHQLLVHPDIPYSSQNSSMCFVAELAETKLGYLTRYASEFVQLASAVGADPGLCVAAFDKIPEPAKLMAFGLKAKYQVVTKQEAYSLAKAQRIHLSEHGGTGQGVVGALAGVGLRLIGNDGLFNGKHKLKLDDDPFGLRKPWPKPVLIRTIDNV